MSDFYDCPEPIPSQQANATRRWKAESDVRLINDAVLSISSSLGAMRILLATIKRQAKSYSGEIAVDRLSDALWDIEALAEASSNEAKALVTAELVSAENDE